MVAISILSSRFSGLDGDKCLSGGGSGENEEMRN